MYGEMSQLFLLIFDYCLQKEDTKLEEKEESESENPLNAEEQLQLKILRQRNEILSKENADLKKEV